MVDKYVSKYSNGFSMESDSLVGLLQILSKFFQEMMHQENDETWPTVSFVGIII